MAGFLYFKPNQQQQPDKHRVEEWNLAHAFDNPPESRELTGATPSGEPGLLMGDQNRMGEKAVGYYPAEQEWVERADWWIGWYKDAKPGPDDLTRDGHLPGYVLTMGDGNQWRLPVVRSVDDNGVCVCVLPRVLRMDPEGKVSPGEPSQRYRHLWEATEWAWDAMVKDEDIEEDRAAKVVGMIFGANYHVSQVELFALGLFTTLLPPAAVLAAAISYVDWAAWSEKNSEATEAA